jgi:hypothetical protein
MTALTVRPAPAEAVRGSGSRPVAPVRREPGRSNPRLLLPPLSEAPANGTPPPGEALPRVRSVLAPVTETAWSVAARRVADASAPDLPDPERLCGAVVVAAIEALHSTRPLRVGRVALASDS